MCPLEFTATPGTSPKFIPGGNFKKSDTVVKASCGTFCCASTGPAISIRTAARNFFMRDLLCKSVAENSAVLAGQVFFSELYGRRPARGFRRIADGRQSSIPLLISPGDPVLHGPAVPQARSDGRIR